MKVLITGSEGFVGSHLVEHCLAHGDEVWGTCLPGQPLANLAAHLDQITLRIGDVTDPRFIGRILAEARFDAFYHLAAISFARKAEQDPQRAYVVNLLSALYALEAVRLHQPGVRVVLASSAEVYGHVPLERMPIGEDEPLHPANLIGASKAALEMAAGPYTRSHGLNIVIARPFNHTGPRQSIDYVCSSFARQMVEVESGLTGEILVGDMAPRRDFSDVRDIVRGYRLLALSGKSGEV
jgi:GDP-4-dehydro-6-deoxy-D-mannose reductase